MTICAARRTHAVFGTENAPPTGSHRNPASITAANPQDRAGEL